MSYAIIIPSKKETNLLTCIDRLREMGETGRIVVVWDGDNPPPREQVHKFGWVEFIPGVKPFVFARNINCGLRATGQYDVVLMNDDALLCTPRGLERLSSDCAHNPDYGVIAASVDLCGTQNQVHDIRPGLREERVMLAFVCVYVPRTVIHEVGVLDERFGVNAGGPGARGYGLEDDDYCWRVREAGLKLGVQNDVVVNHTTLPSTFRGDKEHPHNVFVHEALFEKKWGKHPRKP